MKPCEPYLYEFLWRGRAPGDETPAAWHVAIETRVSVGGDHVVPHVRTLNVGQATKEGWDLKKIAAAIDTEALAELEQLRARTAELNQENQDLYEAQATARAEVKTRELLNTQLQIALRDRADAADSLAKDRDEARAQILRLVAVVDEQTAMVKAMQAKLPKTAPSRRRAPRGPNARR